MSRAVNKNNTHKALPKHGNIAKLLGLTAPSGPRTKDPLASSISTEMHLRFLSTTVFEAIPNDLASLYIK